MSEVLAKILQAIIPGMLSLAGVYMANRKNSALIAYRLEELEKKVDEHNKVVMRTYQLEGRMNEAEHDIRDLKGRRAS